jgi:dTDP-4-dehydrorhamnose reductase
MSAIVQPRILLVGQTGQVGWELRRSLAPLGPLVCLDYPELDLTDSTAIRQQVRAEAPKVIVNAAAYTAVDKAESEPDLCLKINGVAPGILAEEAKRLGAWLIHYSTDYVFDGTKTTPYVEDDSPNPLSTYGRTKLAGDQAIRQVDCDHLIFRLCWVYGARGHNFMHTMLSLARERETLRVVCDQIGAPTWSRLIAEATGLALKQVLDSKTPEVFKGTYHLSAAGVTSWHGFAESIISLMPAAERCCRRVDPIPTAEYPTAAKRPASSVLCNDKLRRVFGLKLPDWADSLRQVLESERP